MRTTRSTEVTKILPSPILPVRAALTMASTQRSTSSVLTTTSTFTLGRKSTTYSAPRYSSVWPFWRPKPLTSVTVRPVTPHSASPSRTSSSLKGLMTAVICFIFSKSSDRVRPGSGSEAVGHRITPILAKTAVRHTNAHRGLAALVFIELDEARHLLDVGSLVTVGDQRGHALVVFHVALDDGVQHLVFGQAVLVLLVRTQFGAGRPGDDALGDRVAAGAVGVVLVAPARQRKHPGLEHVLDHREPAGHVAVEGAVAGRHLALVAGGQHDRPGLVGQGHQKRAADAGLDVFFGGVFGQVRKLAGQCAAKALEE